MLVSSHAATAADQQTEAEREIQYLITFVADSGASFVRNGTAHDAKEAAGHLAMKYRNASRYAKTADDFIDNLASKSSITRRLYTVTTADGRELTASEWLHSALDEYRQSVSASSP
ncbi:DUF5329 domain-containing protein [Pseudomaricurvus sp. HS19]|uniref:DUF5329 family protein n=1 Tax=Pseudomaricurvus sp. HS19 TaxID=2692626 RepID=UPI001367A86C|nr:DUF5329 domain-containing protein [Pseudomaricurvus sp. HS19]MYM62957.1 hypothetical protein [Pseudomaricurvus sp. HS19]